MIRWIKKNSFEILIVCAIVVGLAGMGFYAWFVLTHTCVEWEPVPTGSYCAAWTTDTSTDSEGNVSTSQRCIERRSCRECTKWVEDEKVGEKPVVPPDACPLW